MELAVASDFRWRVLGVTEQVPENDEFSRGAHRGPLPSHLLSQSYVLLDLHIGKCDCRIGLIWSQNRAQKTGGRPRDYTRGGTGGRTRLPYRRQRRFSGSAPGDAIPGAPSAQEIVFDVCAAYGWTLEYVRSLSPADLHHAYTNTRRIAFVGRSERVMDMVWAHLKATAGKKMNVPHPVQEEIYRLRAQEQRSQAFETQAATGKKDNPLGILPGAKRPAPAAPSGAPPRKTFTPGVTKPDENWSSGSSRSRSSDDHLLNTPGEGVGHHG